MKALLLLSLLIPSLALAQFKSLHVVILKGEGSAPLNNTTSILTDVENLYWHSGVPVMISKITIELDRRPDLATLSGQSARLSFWKSIGERKGWRKGVRAVHIVAPPIKQGEDLYFAGVAARICGKSKMAYSISNLGLLNAKAQPRYYQSYLAAGHEIGHILGASHIDSYSLMNHGILHLFNSTSKEVAIDPISLEQINRCR